MSNHQMNLEMENVLLEFETQDAPIYKNNERTGQTYVRHTVKFKWIGGTYAHSTRQEYSSKEMKEFEERYKKFNGQFVDASLAMEIDRSGFSFRVIDIDEVEEHSPATVGKTTSRSRVKDSLAA